ncbi:MAG: hypothetical protein SynsKO_34700 [Synoicihabitans sp.]
MTLFRPSLFRPSTPTGYQLFEQDMIDRVQLIRSLQAKRLTLSEIKTELNL